MLRSGITEPRHAEFEIMPQHQGLTFVIWLDALELTDAPVTETAMHIEGLKTQPGDVKYPFQ